MALGFLLGSLLVYRLIMIFLPNIRPRMIHAQTKAVSYDTLKVIARKTSLGDWWILYNLASVIDPAVYRDTLMSIAKEIETNASNKSYNHQPPCYSSSNGVGNAASAPPEMYHQQSTV